MGGMSQKVGGDANAARFTDQFVKCFAHALRERDET